MAKGERRIINADCEGQLNLICESCEGQRIICSEDTPSEVCADCNGTGIDPDAAFDAVIVRSFYLEARWTPPTG